MPKWETKSYLNEHITREFTRIYVFGSQYFLSCPTLESLTPKRSSDPSILFRHESRGGHNGCGRQSWAKGLRGCGGRAKPWVRGLWPAVVSQSHVRRREPEPRAPSFLELPPLDGSACDSYRCHYIQRPKSISKILHLVCHGYKDAGISEIDFNYPSQAGPSACARGRCSMALSTIMRSWSPSARPIPSMINVQP